MLTNDLEAYYTFKDEPNRGALLAIRSCVSSFHDEIEEKFKWKVPFFTYNNKNLCYLNIDAKTEEPYIGFYNGHLMEHPSLISDGRKQIKIFTIDPELDIDIENLEKLLHLAIEISPK